MRKAFILIVISSVLFACKKEKSINGIVKDYGPIELDGCGWVIDVNGEIYKPTNLEPQYQVHDLQINFDYQNLNTNAHCGLNADAFEEIEILEIN